MKKRIICLLAALLLLLGLSVSASAAVYANVIDTAELLSESEAEALTRAAASSSRPTAAASTS